MPHATTPREPSLNGITISTFLDAGSPFSSKNLGRKRQSRPQQYPTDLPRWLHANDLENPNLLSPEDVSGDICRPGRRFSFNSLNPFSSSSSRRSSVSSSSRASSRDGRQQEADGDRTGIFRSPLMNPSPPTRRPRAQSPPPAYSESPSAASGPTLGTPPTYSENGASTGASTSTPSRGRGGDSSSTSASSSHRGIGKGLDDDDFKFLETFDTVFLIDDSASMYGRRWRETGEALMSVVPECTARDADGVDVWFLNKKDRRNQYRNVTRAREDETGTGTSVQELFRQRRPDGDATLTGTRLREILNPYVRRCERIEAENKRRADQGLLDADLELLDLPKPINIIVITDGRASDDPGSVLREMAGRLDAIRAPPYQVGVQFFQVGDDERATRSLRQLDNELGAVRDMVDTVTFDAVGNGRNRTPGLTRDGILKTVLGAVNRRYDNNHLASRS